VERGVSGYQPASAQSAESGERRAESGERRAESGERRLMPPTHMHLCNVKLSCVTYQIYHRQPEFLLLQEEEEEGEEEMAPTESGVYALRFARSWNANVFVIGLGGIPLFLALLIENKTALDVLGSISVQSSWSSIVILALMSPLIIDRILDSGLRCFSHANAVTEVQRHRDEDAQLFTSEMSIVMAGLTTASVLYLSEASLSTYLAGRAFRCTLVIGAIAVSISRIDPKFWWSRWAETLVLLSFVASQVFRVYYDTLRSIGDSRSYILRYLWIITAVIAIVSFYVAGIIWLYRRVIRSHCWNSDRITDESAAEMSSRSQSNLNIFSRISRRSVSSDGSSRRRASSIGISVGPAIPSAVSVRSVGSSSMRRKLKTRSAFQSIESQLDRDVSKMMNNNGQYYGNWFVVLSLICITVILISSVNEYNTQGYNFAAFAVTDCSYIFLELVLLLLPMRRTKSDVISGLVRIEVFCIFVN
jgi:hypothetical protein